MSVRRDYKPDSTRQGGRRRIRLHGLLVLTLVTIGLFSSLLAYIRGKVASDAAAQPPLAAVSQPVAAARPVEPAPIPAAPTVQPKYDFYKVLPERKLVIATTEPPQRAKSGQTGLPPVDLIGRSQGTNVPGAAGNAAGQTRAAKNATHYTLHAGSFRNPAEASQRKASLAALGIPARVEIITETGGATVHRVRIGPVRDANEMKTLRQRLQDKNIPVSVKPAE